MSDPGPEDAQDGAGAGRPRIQKSAAAFRTISEVAEDLHIPQHVLRFWETKFPQLKPLKRGGGRRYYRPEDIALLKRVSDLLYTQGYTIKGVQRLLRDGGLEGEPGGAGELPLPEPVAAETPLVRAEALLVELEGLLAELKALAAG